jgi:hypothetical protein
MGFRVRVWLLGTVACATAVVCTGMALAVPVADAAGFGVESFFAANCKVSTCNKAANPSEEKKKAEEEGYSQAAGHPPYGITDFKLNRVEAAPGLFVPVKDIKNLRVDVAPGVSTNPQAVAKCSIKGFTGTEVEPVHHLFTKPECPESATNHSENSVIGENKVETVLEVAKGVFEDVPLKGKVYNLEQPDGLSSYFGVALEIQPGVYAHTFLEGHIEWGAEPLGTGKADYHDFFEIKNIAEGLLESRLIFEGNIGTGGFLTNPSHCAGSGPLTTTGWRGESYEGETATSTYTTPIGTEGCLGEGLFTAPPFLPTFSVTPATTQSDQPDGVTTELAVPHSKLPTELDSSQLRNATITLPEGMTLNPPGATGLKTCSAAQIGIGTRNPVTCPAESRLGTVTLKVPDLPESEPLKGHLFLGGSEPITKSPYTVYLEATTERYGVSVRLQGTVETNESTGRVTAKFLNNPEQPFSSVKIVFNEGALASMANPLSCGTATTETSLTPYTGTATQSPFSAFIVDSNGSGGACASPLPFSLSQSTVSQPITGGAPTSFTFNLARADGQQYLSHVTTALPLGLVGKIASVPQCPEPQATTGECSSESQIGTVTTTVGSGSAAAQFSGPVYLTGPTGGAPFGMTTVINTAIGPFNLGNVVVRSKIEVNPYTAQVTVSSEVPTIYKGIPLRMKTLSLAINRQGFLINPTNCVQMSTNSTLTSSLSATQAVSTLFQASGCSSLTFAPKFGASSNAKTSRANGAALVTNINIPSTSQANFKSVLVTLPKQLPSRLTTLKNACVAAVFEANPGLCPANSVIGTARVKTPVLPSQLSGNAYYVSHGGAAFPDVDLVLRGDGVTVIMVGNTNIKNGITTTTFASLPDVPFTGFELNLPSGPNSAVTAIGNICKQSLAMPTTITAQNGKVFKQNTVITVSGCPMTILSSKAKGNKALITIRVPEAGRVSGGGSNLGTVYKYPGKAQKVTLEVPVKTGRRPIVVRVRIGFVPKAKGKKTSSDYTSVLFK